MNTSHGTLDGDAEVDELTACLPRRRSTNRVGLGVVLALDTLEGLAVYTIVSSVVLFCEDNLSLSKTEAVVVYLIFGAIMFIVPCITGALGDAVVTRYTCILASLAVFLLGGLVMLSLALIMSQDMDFRPRRALYMVSLVLVGVGSGGCISVSIPFGADQLADPSPRNMWSFFIWKHWFYCLGKFLGYLPLPDVLKAVDKDTHKETVLLPQAIIVVVAVGLGIGILLLGKPRFNIVQPQGKKIFSRLKNGFSMCLPCLCRESFDYVSLGSSTSLTDERRDNRLLLKRVILLSALFSLFGIYTIFHYQLSSTFMLQAEELQNASPLPVISLNMCGPIVALLAIPLVEVHNRYKIHWKNMTNLDIMLSGVIPLSSAAAAAAILQWYIRNAPPPGVTLWAQIPLYICTGLADLLCYTPATEFAYKESPKHIEGFIIGMMFTTGSLLTLMVYIIEEAIFYKYVPDKTDIQYQYHFYAVFGFTAFVFIVVLMPFVHIYRRFKGGLNDTQGERLVDVTGSHQSDPETT